MPWPVADYCVGSSRDKLDDVVACFPVGSKINSSGTVVIKYGKVYHGHTVLANISFYRPPDENNTYDLTKNELNLEPGKYACIISHCILFYSLCVFNHVCYCISKTPLLDIGPILVPTKSLYCHIVTKGIMDEVLMIIFSFQRPIRSYIGVIKWS